jgi:hypothetical protein
MYQNVVLCFFFLLVGIICVDLISDLFLIDFTYYLLSLFILGLGIVVYPFDFRFRYKTDFIFLLVLLMAIVNLINLFGFSNFSFLIYCVNIFVGVFGILLSLLRRNVV